MMSSRRREARASNHRPQLLDVDYMLAVPVT